MATLAVWLLAGAALTMVGDGDTVTFGTETVRIANIDAPELHQPRCAAEREMAIAARARLAALLAGGRVELHRGDPVDGRLVDRHGRTLATITVDGRDVGEMMIAEGLARPWTGKRRPWC